MGWSEPTESLLFATALELLKSLGSRESPDFPEDTYYDLTVEGKYSWPIYILGDLEHPHDLEICLIDGERDMVVLAKDINGNCIRDMYQEAESPLYRGFQKDVLSVLQSYNVLDALSDV
jgi:hypothetical protein